MDGSVSTLAPVFAAAFATQNSWDALLVGMAASIGAGISMGFAEALSDDGLLSGRGHPWLRGLVCGLMTTLGGVGHTLPYLFGGSSRWDFPDEVLQTYRHENLLIEIMFPITWGGRWDYPYPEAQAFIRGMHDLFGASKLVWGSDAPNVERFCTYKQSLDYVKTYCTFLAGSEMDAVLGGNIQRLFGLAGTPPSAALA